MKYLSFIPKTTGEYLFQFIVKDVLQGDFSDVRSLGLLTVGARGEPFAEYFHSLVALNILGRSIKKAERVIQSEDEAKHHFAMVSYLQKSMAIARQHDSRILDKLASTAILAAKESKLKMKDSVKNLVCNGRREMECYICGATVLRKSEDKTQQVQFEHLWPSSFGGNTIADNLLPACPACNGAKGDMLLWHGFINSFVLKPNPSGDELSRISRREKIARHSKKIFDLACFEEITLKEAALTIGSVTMSAIYSQEEDDSMDFFNFDFNKEGT